MEEQKPDLLTVIQSYGITPKRSGKNLMASCPFHEDKHPSFSIDEAKGLFHCFSCNASGDVFHFVALQERLDIKTDFPKIKKMAFEKVGASMPKNLIKPNIQKKIYPQIDLDKAHKVLMESSEGESGREYLESRGIKKETWTALKLGFATEGTYENRILIPIKDNWFTSRAVDDQKPKAKHSSGPIPSLFNMKILKEVDSVFLVEGSFDALTLIQEGNDNTVGLLGTQSLKEEFLKDFSGKEVLIIMDNDDQGVRAREELQRKLERTHATVLQVYIEGGKDINEIYMKDQEGFFRTLKAALVRAEQDKDRHFGDEDYLEKVWLKREDFKDPIKTGFRGLDDHLGGGFYPGVIMLGGDTSIGKTALAVYWSIEAAKQQRRVLYLTYELSKKQMWSRIFGAVMKSPFKDIHFNPDREKAYKDIYNKDIKKLARYIKVLEDCTFENLVSTADSYDLIIVDYLQRMPNLENEGSWERRIQITNLVHRLQKDIARIWGVSVLVLSSYSRGATQEGEPGMLYKESGDIEYTTQVGMSLWFPQKPEEKHLAAKNRFNREPIPILKLSVYKNTIGATGTIFLEYTKGMGVFEEKKSPDNMIEKLIE